MAPQKSLGRSNMMRRMMLALFVMLVAVSSAWPKFNAEDQEYLNNNFKLIQQKIESLNTQLQNLNAQLQVLLKNQAQFQALIDHQQRSLQELDQMVSSMRMGTEEDASRLKTAITQLRSETQAAFAKLGATNTPGAPAAAETAVPKPAAPTATVVQGSIISDVRDNMVKIDLGSRQGVHELSRLLVYKDTDPNTQVGILEVTQVIDAGNSWARVYQVNPGVQLGFGDVVRLQ